MRLPLGKVLRGVPFAVFLLLMVLGHPTKAQSFEDFSDDVLLYVRDGQSDHPSIVLYDAKAIQANANARRPVVEFTLDFSGATERWDFRAVIDDRFDELLKAAPARLAVTHTEPKQGRRTYLLVSSDPDRVVAALKTIVPPPGITATYRTLTTSELEAWAPTPLEFQDAQDQRVREALAEQGDDGTKPRLVEFFFYGGDLAALRDAAKQQGFQMRETRGRRGVILSRQTAVDSRILTVWNALFIDWSSRFGVECDGWETELAKK
jgi:ubiquitin